VRYFRVTLLLGFIVSLLVALLYETGQFIWLDSVLAGFLGPVRRLDEFRSLLQYGLWVSLAFAIAWTTVDINRVSLKLVVGIGALLNVITATWVLKLYGWFVSPWPALMAITGSLILGLVYSRSRAGRRKQIVRAMFGDRISRDSFHRLVNGNSPLTFEGEIRYATAVVCEILNHDELMDALPVSDYVALNNRFLSSATDQLVDHGGYLDECDGESLRVIFGAPLPDERHAEHACEAVQAMVRELETVNRECHERWGQMFDFRVGVNSGEMVLAAYGSKRLGMFSVAGEPVEFARRLCAANSIFGSKVLIGSCTHELAAGAIEVRPIDLIRNRHDRSRDEVYEFLAMRNVLSDEDLQRRDMFWKGVLYCREQNWQEAIRHFEASLPPDRHDGPAEFYLRKIEHLRAGLPALGWSDAKFLSA
jgi:adenylate cyclase